MNMLTHLAIARVVSRIWSFSQFSPLLTAAMKSKFRVRDSGTGYSNPKTRQTPSDTSRPQIASPQEDDSQATGNGRPNLPRSTPWSAIPPSSFEGEEPAAGCRQQDGRTAFPLEFIEWDHKETSPDILYHFLRFACLGIMPETHVEGSPNRDPVDESREPACPAAAMSMPG